MNYTVTGQCLTVCLEGHIDSANASAAEADVRALRAANPHSSLVIDAEKLEYISSAGLRVLLRLRKEERDLQIINVSPEVYEILSMTGFTEMMTVKKAYRQFSVEGCKVLGEGSNGIVYRYDPELVIKVYKNPDALDDIFREQKLARTALILGIPTAIPFDVVKADGRYASVFELLDARSLSELIRAEPEKLDEYVDIYVDLLKQIHSTEVKPSDMPDMKQVAIGWAKFLKDHLPAAQAEKLCALVEAVPDRHTMIHGDYHTNNVVMQNGETLLIDMDTLSYGHPIFEFASMFLGFIAFGELDPSVTLHFLGLPSETAHVIFKKAMCRYFGADDIEQVRPVIEKASIIGYARLLRRTIRREADTDHGKKQIALCKQKLADLLERVDTLDF